MKEFAVCAQYVFGDDILSQELEKFTRLQQTIAESVGQPNGFSMQFAVNLGVRRRSGISGRRQSRYGDP